MFGQKILDVRGTSFQRKRLTPRLFQARFFLVSRTVSDSGILVKSQRVFRMVAELLR